MNINSIIGLLYAYFICCISIGAGVWKVFCFYLDQRQELETVFRKQIDMAGNILMWTLKKYLVIVHSKSTFIMCNNERTE